MNKPGRVKGAAIPGLRKADPESERSERSDSLSFQLDFLFIKKDSRPRVVVGKPITMMERLAGEAPL